MPARRATRQASRVTLRRRAPGRIPSSMCFLVRFGCAGARCGACLAGAALGPRALAPGREQGRPGLRVFAGGIVACLGCRLNACQAGHPPGAASDPAPTRPWPHPFRCVVVKAKPSGASSRRSAGEKARCRTEARPHPSPSPAGEGRTPAFHVKPHLLRQAKPRMMQANTHGPTRHAAPKSAHSRGCDRACIGAGSLATPGSRPAWPALTRRPQQAAVRPATTRSPRHARSRPPAGALGTKPYAIHRPALQPSPRGGGGEYRRFT